MKSTDRFKLLHGPYHPPKTKRGRRLFCEIRGTVIVSRFRDGPIPWPCAKQWRSPMILCGDLVKAVKRESEIAVAHHFGVSIGTVQVWRRALGVPRNNDGSQQLWQRVEAERTDDRFARARKNSKTPAALAKASASLKGRIQSPATIEAVRRAAKRPRSESWKKKMADYWQKRGRAPGGRFWTAEEIALLGTDTDAAIGLRIDRSTQAVSDHRIRLGIMSFREQRQLARPKPPAKSKQTRSEEWKKKMAALRRKRGHPPGHPESRFWTAEEDALLGKAFDRVIAQRIGRTLSAVSTRREKLGIEPFRRWKRDSN